MHNILFNEFKQYKKNNLNDGNLDLIEYPPVEIEQIGKKNKDLKSVDSVMHYDLSRFQTVEGIYYFIKIICIKLKLMYQICYT